MMQVHKIDEKNQIIKALCSSLQSVNFLITTGIAMEAQTNTALHVS